jgi:hypothetical protein
VKDCYPDATPGGNSLNWYRESLGSVPAASGNASNSVGVGGPGKPCLRAKMNRLTRIVPGESHEQSIFRLRIGCKNQYTPTVGSPSFTLRPRGERQHNRHARNSVF